MDIHSILSKTKAKSDKIKRTSTIVQIAIKDRPYDRPSLSQTVSDHNITQSPHKPNTNLTQKLTQSLHKPNTNLTQSSHKPDTKAYTNLTQSPHKPNTNLTQFLPYFKISMVVGLQRKILEIVYKSCKKTRSFISEPLTLYSIQNELDIVPGSIKTTLVRLEQKGFLIKKAFKNGRGGWCSYELPDPVYKALFHLEEEGKLEINLTQTQHKPNTNFSNNSNNNYITITTKEEVTEDWQRINISPLESIGFTTKHLKDIFESNSITAELTQESINHFAYGLENYPEKYKKYTDLIHVFIGCLRKGKPWFEATYLSPKELAAKEFLAIKKAEQERMEKMRLEIISLEYQAWLKNLTLIQKKEYVLSINRDPNDTDDITLKKIFLNEIFPTAPFKKMYPDLFIDDFIIPDLNAL